VRGVWLNRLAADRYDMGIIKLVSRYDKCVNFESGYVEMLVKVWATTCIFVFFLIINTHFLIAKHSLLSGYPSYSQLYIFQVLFAPILRSTTAAYSHRCVYLWKAEVVLVSSGVELYFA
jgi:hypothetical protein